MLWLLVIILLAALISVTFLLGFRLGDEGWLAELQRTRAHAAQAERRMHDLTRQAFISMGEAAERHREK